MENTEVEIKETIEYGETDMRSVMEGDRLDLNENLSNAGFTTQEFDENEELVNVESEFDLDSEDLLDDAE